MRSSFQKLPEQLERQQKILTALGFYKGEIDGLWGPLSIAAMANWESSPSFLPGIPNHGMPLEGVAPFPAGVTKDFKNRNLLTHPALADLEKPIPKMGLVELPEKEDTKQKAKDSK